MDIQTVSVVVAMIGLLIAAVNQIYTSRQANAQRQNEIETRQAELFMNIYDKYTTEDFQYAHQVMTAEWDFTDFDDFYAKHGPVSKTRDYALFAMMAVYYEGIGVLVARARASRGYPPT